LKLRSDACLDRCDWPDSGEVGHPFNLPHGRTGSHTQLRNVAWTAPPYK